METHNSFDTGPFTKCHGAIRLARKCRFSGNTLALARSRVARRKTRFSTGGRGPMRTTRLAMAPRLWQKPDAFGGDAPRCCSSSVVEHSLGKGEVESSILSCSTIFPKKINLNGAVHSLFPSEQTAKVPQKFRCHPGKIRGPRSLSVRAPFRCRAFELLPRSLSE